MKADPAALIRLLHALGVTVSIHGERLRIEAPRGFLTPEIRETLRQMKPQLRAHLERIR